MCFPPVPSHMASLALALASKRYLDLRDSLLDTPQLGVVCSLPLSPPKKLLSKRDNSRDREKQTLIFLLFHGNSACPETPGLTD